MLNFLKSLFIPKTPEQTLSIKFEEKVEKWFSVDDKAYKQVKVKIGDEFEITYDNKSLTIYSGHTHKNGNYFLCHSYNKYLIGQGKIYGKVLEREGDHFKLEITNPKILNQKEKINKTKDTLLNNKELRNTNIEQYHQKIEKICNIIFEFNRNYNQKYWLDNPLNELTIVRKKVNFPLNKNLDSYFEFCVLSERKIDLINKRISKKK